MITGSVNARRQPIVSLTVSGPSGTSAEAETLLDTGYNGALTLPVEVVEALGLLPRRTVTVNLADGSSAEMPVYAASVMWDGVLRDGVLRDGVLRDTRVIAGGTQPLLGMSLTLGHRVIVEMVDGGAVTIERL